MDLGLNSKIAVVTGGSEGIGKATATALVARGREGSHLRPQAGPARERCPGDPLGKRRRGVGRAHGRDAA